MRGAERRKQTPVLQEVAHLSLALSNFPGSCIHLTCSICVVIVKPLWWVSFCRNFCLAKPSIESRFDVGRVHGLWKLIWFWVDVLSTEGRIAELGNLPEKAECKHHTWIYSPNRFIDSSWKFTILRCDNMDIACLWRCHCEENCALAKDFSAGAVRGTDCICTCYWKVKEI